MKFLETPLNGSFIIEPRIFEDERGWFARTFSKDDFLSIGHDEAWVQMNHSLTRQAGAIRGLHYQHPPFAEIKLVRCISGAVLDVIVDLRQGSETFLNWFGVKLSAENRKMLYIPKGFAHGFQTLSENCEMLYQHSAAYTPDSEGAINYQDPRVGIRWKLPVTDLSIRDKQHPLLGDSFTGIKI